MFDTLSFVNRGLWDDFTRPELSIMYNQIDWSKLSVADFDSWVLVKELFGRRNGLRRCFLGFLFLFKRQFFAALLLRTQHRACHHKLLEVFIAAHLVRLAFRVQFCTRDRCSSSIIIFRAVFTVLSQTWRGHWIFREVVRSIDMQVMIVFRHAAAIATLFRKLSPLTTTIELLLDSWNIWLLFLLRLVER